MSKLVINTQYRENYAAHNEDFVPGVSADYWKFKGGTTYVVANITPAHAMKIGVHGIPNLEKLVTYSNPGSEEYILDYEIVEDDNAPVCEEWETPIMLEFDTMLKAWRATKTTINGDMGYMRSEIAEKQESWMVLPENDRDDYRVLWTMKNGDLGTGQEFLSKWFAKLDLNKEVA